MCLYLLFARKFLAGVLISLLLTGMETISTTTFGHCYWPLVLISLPLTGMETWDIKKRWEP